MNTHFRPKYLCTGMAAMSIVGLSLFISGCGGGHEIIPTIPTTIPTTINTPGPNNTPTPIPVGGTGTGTIGATGGTINLPNIAAITVPAGGFSTNKLVTISTTTDPDTKLTFDLSAPLFSATNRLSYNVKVVTDAAPAKDVIVTLAVPASFSSSVPSGNNIETFAQIFESQGLSILDYFQLLPSSYNAATKLVTVTLPPLAFTTVRRSDGKFEAIVTMAPTPGAASTGGGTTGACQGASIGSPLKTTLKVASAFNPPTHYGTDYTVSATGEDVVPVADGTVEVIGFDERNLPKPDPRSGKTVKGWGRYVVIKHSDGSHSLYAHLVKDSTNPLTVGAAVVKGTTVLGTTDNTGGSSGPHLHLEYAPNGSIFSKKNKIDPAPCIGNNANTSIVVGDNGPVADDAFEIFIDGLSIGKTTIGGTNSLGASNLRPGNHELKLVVIVAPDDTGTYGISLKDGITFADGTTTASGAPAQGAVVTYTIVVPTSNALNKRTKALPLPRNSAKEG